MELEPRDVEGGRRRTAGWSAGARLAGAMALAAAVGACGEMTREGTASSYLIIRSIEAATGAEPTEFGGTLLSDVLTVVDDVPTIFNDVGRVTFSLGLKDAGSADAPTEPTSNNFITVTRYRVQFIRADGRNTPGVDVPYGFDGAFTLTVAGGESSTGFTIVRNIAKAEAPLAALVTSPVIISTIAEVTFYGQDQTGREVSATGRIGIDFGNFGDPN
ncbi:MAG TPA: hypothetical protein VD833_08340 [Vicinamibacterales bacterium]|nr:hypothetical protein [Vicinamibacterales bacterium]